MINIEYAAVIGHTEHAVLYADDAGTAYYLPMEDPEAFEVGTVQEISTLTPISLAKEPFKKELLAFIGGVE